MEVSSKKKRMSIRQLAAGVYETSGPPQTRAPRGLSVSWVTALEGHHLIERRYQTRRWCFPRHIWTSTDSGTTWTENTSKRARSDGIPSPHRATVPNSPLLFRKHLDVLSPFLPVHQAHHRRRLRLAGLKTTAFALCLSALAVCVTISLSKINSVVFAQHHQLFRAIRTTCNEPRPCRQLSSKSRTNSAGYEYLCDTGMVAMFGTSSLIYTGPIFSNSTSTIQSHERNSFKRLAPSSTNTPPSSRRMITVCAWTLL